MVNQDEAYYWSRNIEAFAQNKIKRLCVLLELMSCFAQAHFYSVNLVAPKPLGAPPV